MGSISILWLKLQLTIICFAFSDHGDKFPDLDEINMVFFEIFTLFIFSYRMILLAHLVKPLPLLMLFYPLPI